MTYCVAAKISEGLVFLSDSRTNAGVDDISITKKMTIYKKKNDRTIFILCAGNLAITQSVKTLLIDSKGKRFWEASSLYTVAEVVGNCIREVRKRDGKHLSQAGLDFNCSFIVGGHILGEEPRLFKIYSAGNFIESDEDSLYFQIGESKYGKPILDRVLTNDISLEAAAKCMLLSMDSTIRSNISVGLPLDMCLYEKESPNSFKHKHLNKKDKCYEKLKSIWSTHLKEGFNKLENIEWDDSPSVDVKYPIGYDK